MSERELPPASFEGAQLAQMRKWVHSGAGADAVYDNAKQWQKEDELLRKLKEEIAAKLKDAGAVMQSKSGEALQNQAMPVVLWTEVTADSAKLQSERMHAQGEAFKKVQHSIPAKGEEQSVPDDGWFEEGWDSFWTGSTDAEDAKAHNERLRQEAVQAFTTYQDTTQTNVSGSATFEKPPEIAVQSTGGATGSNHPSVGGVGSSSPSSTSSAWAGGSGSGAGGYAGSGAGAGGSYGGGAFGGGAAGTGAAWATPPGGGSGSNQNPGGAGRVPNGPGVPGGTPGLGAGRPGVPGSGAGGRSGAGSGAGGRAGAGRGLGAGSGAGAGGRAGVGGSGTGAGGRAGAGGLGGAAGAGGRGGAGAGAGAGARGRGQEGEDDLEHETPDYLIGDQGVFDEDLPKVAPPVFGDWDNQR